MGLLFTTEGTRRIINTLNTAFDESDGGLKFIRGYLQTNPPSALYTLLTSTSKWQPGQLAVALDLMPYDQGSGDGNQGNGPHPPNGSKGKKTKDTWRWNYFLTNVVGPSAAFAPLQNALATAILNTATDAAGNALNIIRVSFDHVELDENSQTSGTAPPSVVIFDAPLLGNNGASLGTVRHITLFTVRVASSQTGTAFSGKPIVSGQKWQHPGNG